MAVGFFVLIVSFIKLVIGKKEGFIVHGDFVDDINRFPHVAFLELAAKDGTYICGSSILNQFILITAAHCLDNVNAIIAYVGSLNREQGQPCEVESFEQHKKWDSYAITHDIGLCKLRTPLRFRRSIKRVLLLKHPPKSLFADLAGWGAVEETDYTDSVMLKHTVQKLWTHEQCKTVLHNAPKGTICGGDSHAWDYASKGDSGSGLLIKHKIIVGLVSYKDLSVSRSLVVYTDVAHYYDWIVNTAKQLCCA